MIFRIAFAIRTSAFASITLPTTSAVAELPVPTQLGPKNCSSKLKFDVGYLFPYPLLGVHI